MLHCYESMSSMDTLNNKVQLPRNNLKNSKKCKEDVGYDKKKLLWGMDHYYKNDEEENINIYQERNRILRIAN